ncbi:hypothetical protein CJJ23_04205 [Mycoplasmopsis agassizii]|uniref:Lipoprotein n=1 Tax=Mycoplasmopsis agassizii TaxID=33922 RepID=A0A269THX0_9BACT|nr:hypothetical protein [Mycoplasmopsis agassizii]PAK20981.1 hypothetical protein CJJ23_04205 [Mycoplasmopsis agassizii]
MQKFKKLFLFSTLVATPILASLTIACSSSGINFTEEDRRFAETGKGTDVSVKVLENQKSIVQLKYVGYEHFTFSDYWWSEFRSKNIKLWTYSRLGIDIEKGLPSDKKEKFWIQEKSNPETDNHEVFFKIDSLDNLKKGISKSTVLENSLKKGDQKNSETQFKSVSLITDENSLKTQLRVTDEEKFSKFVKEKIDPEIKDEDIDKMKPWNYYFNYDVIKQKLDLENNNYLFIKVLTDFVDFPDSPNEEWLVYHKVDKGIQIEDYKVDVDLQTITLKFGYITVPEKPGRAVSWVEKPYIFKTPETITSFLLPVSKNEITDFDFNEWKIVRDNWS